MEYDFFENLREGLQEILDYKESKRNMMDWVHDWHSGANCSPGKDGWYLTWDGEKLEINFYGINQYGYLKWMHNDKNIKYYLHLPNLPTGEKFDDINGCLYMSNYTKSKSKSIKKVKYE